MRSHSKYLSTIIGNDNPNYTDANCDSKFLQNALDLAEPGAVITLEGVFDFGKDQFISLKKDVKIQGKRGSNGEYLTTIKGGMNTIALGWDPAMGFPSYDENCDFVTDPNSQRWPAQFTIEDIQFVKPTWTAIMCAASTKVTIKNNVFIGGWQINAGCNAYGFDPPDGSMSAILLTTVSDARRPVRGTYSDITGQIKIENNYFNGRVWKDVNGFDPAHGVSSLIHEETIRLNGMMIPIQISGTEAQITVSNNEFENIMWGLFFSDNSGVHRIERNKIMMNPQDKYGNPIGFVWAGISVQNFGDRVNKAPITIQDNHIYSKVPDFFYGILSGSKAVSIKNNYLELAQTSESLLTPYGDSAGIKILRESENNTIENNTIKGSGQSAIVVEGAGEDGISENNIIKNNRVNEFIPLKAKDTWCRIKKEQDCPIYDGSHYHLTEFTRNNTIISRRWTDNMVLIDDTSKSTLYHPRTYNGANRIQLNG